MVAIEVPNSSKSFLGVSSGTVTAFHRAVKFSPTWGELAEKTAAGGDETAGLREAVGVLWHSTTLDNLKDQSSPLKLVAHKPSFRNAN